MSQLIIAPSILSLNFAKTNEQMDEINQSKAEWIHFDVMDGHFVPNITFGPDVLNGFRKITHKYIDVHMMIDNPMDYVIRFAIAGANMISFHTEALNNDLDKINECIDLIHTEKADAAIVVKPNTNIQQFESLLSKVEMVLVMTVEPGFGGQVFMEEQLEKVKWLKEIKDKNNYSFHIEVDGGINLKTAKMARMAGADVLVAGSYIFGNDIIEAVDSLLKEV